MPRFEVSSNFASHPAALHLTPHQIGIWTMCGSRSAKHRTAGRTTLTVARDFGASDKDIAALVECGLWAVAGDDVTYAHADLCRFIAGDWRPKIPSRIRATVILRAGGMCAQCGSTDEPQIDHIKPWSKGGTHSLDNLQLLCGPCNRAKGDRW